MNNRYQAIFKALKKASATDVSVLSGILKVTYVTDFRISLSRVSSAIYKADEETLKLCESVLDIKAEEEKKLTEEVEKTNLLLIADLVKLVILREISFLSQ